MKNHVSDGGFLCRPIAHIRTDFPEKFGIPRQSGLLPELESRIVFLPEFRNPDALRGITGFSHLWLLWDFSAVPHGGRFQPMVRPPRLGGNTPVGVFATRSPFRPNPIGLSSVRLLRLEEQEGQGTVPVVAGADLMDGTPILDIKPYIPFADCHPDAHGGWIEDAPWHELTVDLPDQLRESIEEDRLVGLVEVLRQDPRRAGSKHDPSRVYHLAYSSLDVAFTVDGDVLHVVCVS